MKVCFFLNGFGKNGGIGRVTSVLANKLAENDNYQVLTLSYLDEGLPNLYPISKKVQQHFLLTKYMNMTKTMLMGGVTKLRRFLKVNKVDILVACGVLYFPISILACQKTATKCICWEHTNPTVTKDYKFQKQARLFGIKRADCNVVLTKSAKDVYENVYNAHNTVQIYNPVDPLVTEKAKAYNADAKKIISVGRLSYPKYFQMAIEVAEEVLGKYPDWVWEIFGDGEERAQLEDLISQKGLEGKMILRGQVSDLYDRYNQYSMMVMTSRYEGFPMTLLEGLGNGLPLVSFDIQTGPNEIIEHEKNGFLIEAFDKEKMVAAIERLIEDGNLREQMGEEAQKSGELFSLDTIEKQWDALFLKLKG